MEWVILPAKTTVLATWEIKYFSFLGALKDLGVFYGTRSCRSHEKVSLYGLTLNC